MKRLIPYYDELFQSSISVGDIRTQLSRSNRKTLSQALCKTLRSRDIRGTKNRISLAKIAVALLPGILQCIQQQLGRLIPGSIERCSLRCFVISTFGRSLRALASTRRCCHCCRRTSCPCRLTL